MTETAPAKAERPVITNAKLTRINRDGKAYPAAIFKGTAPSKGAILHLKLGTTIYSGKVHDATEADGSVIVEFVDGLTLAF